MPTGDWQWALQFRAPGRRIAGQPGLSPVVPDEDGVWRMPDARLARRHPQQHRHIVSDAAMQVRFIQCGGRLGSVEKASSPDLQTGRCVPCS